jgi:hypothetical protein
MKSFAYSGDLNIIAKTGARPAAPIRRNAVSERCNHLRIRPFSDTPCRAAMALEIDKILLCG